MLLWDFTCHFRWCPVQSLCLFWGTRTPSAVTVHVRTQVFLSQCIPRACHTCARPDLCQNSDSGTLCCCPVYCVQCPALRNAPWRPSHHHSYCNCLARFLEDLPFALWPLLPVAAGLQIRVPQQNDCHNLDFCQLFGRSLPTACESPLVYACEPLVFAMCPALQGPLYHMLETPTLPSTVWSTP